jgi:SAM-dependent methyltransferase
VADQPLDDLVARLERERLAADRAYNDALTALDQSLLREPASSLPDHLLLFEHRLIQYLQTITLFVDSKDRANGGTELREQLAFLREQVADLARKVQGSRSPGVQGSGTPITDSSIAGASYTGFEDKFRGSREEIRARLESYAPLFAGASDVLDVGCGRGELLELLRDRGVGARGIDLNDTMVARCQERGLDASHADAVAYLEALPPGSLGGLAAIQVVEHLEPRALQRFLAAAYAALRPGAPLLLETINAASWMAFFETYIRDLTHARPLHPDTLRFLVQASGFSGVDVRFRAPVSDKDRLPRVTNAPPDPALAPLVDAINAHADRLNGRLFGEMDYAVIARR